ncbi:MAG: recombination mediator RecR [Acidobacteria bacterium]|jgi:recombination protein RecR|nr:recombination mediator RecR [Acidobacteriota bacterium]
MADLVDLSRCLINLPGVGKKSAARMISFLLKHKSNGLQLANVLKDILENIRQCRLCGDFTTAEICRICNDSARDNKIICVVEESSDREAIEETGMYHGQYHILHGAINPLEGVGPENLRIKELLERITGNNFAEILIATNPTIDGEATFLYLQNLLMGQNILISRLATGMPMGGCLEYADRLTISKALQAKLYTAK